MPLSQGLIAMQLKSCAAGTPENALGQLLHFIGFSGISALGLKGDDVRAWATAKKVPQELHDKLTTALAEQQRLNGIEPDDGGTNNGQWLRYVHDFTADPPMTIAGIAKKWDVSRAAVQKGLAAHGLRGSAKTEPEAAP